MKNQHINKPETIHAEPKRELRTGIHAKEENRKVPKSIKVVRGTARFFNRRHKQAKWRAMSRKAALMQIGMET